MIKTVRAALSARAIERIYDLYRTLPNQVQLETQPNPIDRHTVALVGKFMLSKFSHAEFDFVWQEVQPIIERELGTDVELVYARVLKYNKTCFIPRHLDSATERSNDYSDISVIIQITDPASYAGGEIILNKELFELTGGDMIFYTYDVEHEVKPIRDGIRYVVNLRCKRSK